MGVGSGADAASVHLQRGLSGAAWASPAAWQDVDESLRTEDDAATLMLSRAMYDDRALIARRLMTQRELDQEWFLSSDPANR